MLVVAVFASCSRDHSEIGGISAGEVEVALNIVTATQHSTRAVIADESKINNLYVLVFDASSAEAQLDEQKAKYLYCRHAWLTGTDTYHTVLKTGAGLNLYFAANAGSLIQDSEINAGDTYETVRGKLLLENPAQTLCDNIPMWGIALGKTIAESDTRVNLGTIRLLRSVASADISIIDKTFVFEQAHIVYAVTKGYLPHLNSNLTPEGQIAILEVPASAAYDFSWSATPTVNSSGDASVENKFYMFENDATASTAHHYTKLIVEGKFNGHSSTFYPLAFRKDNDNKKIQAARNRKFMINVIKVNGDGYPSIDEAKEAEDVNMAYDVIEWDENEESYLIIDGPNFVSFPSGKKAILSDQKNTDTRVYFSTNALTWNGGTPTNLTMSFASDLTGGTTSDRLFNDRFNVQLVQDATDPSGEAYYFLITTKADYTDNTKGSRTATLYLRFGRIQFHIHMEQVPNNWNSGNDIDADL